MLGRLSRWVHVFGCATARRVLSSATRSCRKRIWAAQALARSPVASPLGKALIGHRAGQFATVLAPIGHWRIEVLEVNPAD